MCGQQEDSEKLERKNSYCLPGIVYINRARELSVLGVAVPLSAVIPMKSQRQEMKKPNCLLPRVTASQTLAIARAEMYLN